MFKAAVLAGSILLAGLAVPGTAQEMVDGTNTGVVLDVARGYGSAALQTRTNGDPNILGRIDGIGYAVHFLNCTSDGCSDLNFYTAFAGVKPTPESINAWNREKLYGRAYIDEDGDAALDMDVVVKYGMSRANLDANFSIWRLVLTQFTKHLGL